MEVRISPSEVCYHDPLTKVSLCAKHSDDLSREFLKYAIRRAIIAELEAINMYESMAVHARSLGHEDLYDLFMDIAREEKTHVGEFWFALNLMSDDEHYRLIGVEEAQKIRTALLRAKK